ncbi:hypothetical protein [Natronobacterium gregoryi]|uniref:Uncharacterized protein n=2 Tax=Natronobacterium gregoryi TaxID=44930 RepID=L0ANA6_NATGS|nr:hypothetical protein [Natronobacterium gregoryi]AFZ74560.1 hypothetical protein Natgr_3441 [Natronobacterium gregoryi SP2]ELY72370.1 hypothetical protein C490_03463 [Natronobacterium gregoryi SP2]PLK21698.1 hypothetical protein CYV19_02355 [Natronobacterium gregoryi SP2]SFI96214.1 hypothetical protein SAMN05443661_110145 [Natronobacterium gregoryi]
MNLPNFEDDLREAVLDDVEQTLQEELGPELERVARENWQSYASRHGYDIDFVWGDVDGPIVERDRDSVTLRLEWPGLSALFEFGVDPHTKSGNPVLAFEWASPPEGTRPPGAPEYVVAEEINWGSVTGGISESRAVRDAMNWLRRSLS